MDQKGTGVGSMRIALASDLQLHLEFGDIDLKNDENAEVLILSGDIMIAEDLHRHPEPINTLVNLGTRQQMAIRYRDFLRRVSQDFPYVVYVAGNHEFYHGNWPGHINVLREECGKFDNVFFMENDVKKIGDLTFIGCTLWTDMNKGDPLSLHAIADMMNDFQIIRNNEKGYTKLRPAQVAYQFRTSVDYIRLMIEGKFDEKFVVVGHHGPSHESVHEQFRNQTLTNGAYVSDLSEFILDHPQIKLWTHGHTHYPFDYMIGETRIVCNPRGYVRYEARADEFKLQYLEVQL